MRGAVAQACIALGLVLAVTAPLVSVADDELAVMDTSKVTCGSVVKLTHAQTKYKLHSHDVAYGSGSGQQSVTCFPEANDANSMWVVRPAEGATCSQGDILKNGAIVRFQHGATRKWLHSHVHQSPISGNQEVSCYGGEEESNTSDNWVLELEGGAADWQRNKKIRLKHQVTGVYLHSHQHRFGRPIAGQQEVCGSRARDNNNFWIAAEGVYFPVNQ